MLHELKKKIGRTIDVTKLEGLITDTAVKAVERRMEVETWSQAVHLQKHLSQEQSEEQELCIIWSNKNSFRFYVDHYTL